MEPSPEPTPYILPPIPVGAEIVDLLSIVLLALPFLGFVATLVQWRIYLSDTARPRSWILFLLAVGSATVTVTSLAIAAVALARLVGRPLPEGALVLTLSVVVLEILPIWYTVKILTVRHDARIGQTAREQRPKDVA